MYHLHFITTSLLLLSLAACNAPSSKPAGADSTLRTAITTAPVHTDNCYQRVSGNAQKDSATVHLVINDTLVTGAMVVKIFEKDTRSGILRGSVQNGVIKAQWLFSQEGMSDSIPAVFKLDGDKLLQQRYGYDAKTGREVLSDTSAFAVEYVPVACKLPLQ